MKDGDVPLMPAASIAATLDDALTKVRERCGITPTVALVLGSGLGGFADALQDATTIPYRDLPGMPPVGVSGHAGELRLGHLGGVPVALLCGRAHLYEGHNANAAVFGVRLLIRLGATKLVITNAAGGVRADFAPGTLMAIEDHLNLTGCNPLVGPNDEQLGRRFPDMTQAYEPSWIDVATSTAERLGFSLPSGVYAGLLGPCYETPAEVRMLRGLGADAVGMSTVLEVIAARHMQAKVFGLSCITNHAAGITGQPLLHDEVTAVGAAIRNRMQSFLTALVPQLA